MIDNDTNVFDSFTINYMLLNKLKANHLAAKRLGLYWRSFKITLLVGTILNLINQPQLILIISLIDLNVMQDFSRFKALLTYLVPFFVSLYGGLSVLNIPTVSNQN